MTSQTTSTVTTKGQTTVPKSVRDRLNLTEGTQMDWDVTDDAIIVVRIVQREANPFLAFLGAAPLPDGMSSEELMTELRGERPPELTEGPGANVVSVADFLKDRA